MSKSTDPQIQTLLLSVYYTEIEEPGFLLTAITNLEKLLKERNNAPIIHRLSGDIYLRLKRWQEAQEMYNKTILLATSEKNTQEIALA